MNLAGRLESIERQIKERKLDSKVHFFESLEDCEKAFKDGVVDESDICIIDDISD